jgi:subtilisin family serine protease
MERSYTVLLDRGERHLARRRRGAAFESLEFLSQPITDPPRPAIHRERLTAQELEELSAEPEFVAAAEIMRTRLVSPVHESASEDGSRKASPSPKPWGIGAVAADRSKFTGAGATVALLDTGIDNAHVAFRGVDLAEKDFTGSGNGDCVAHGTHCAGTLFGRSVDGVRIGVAPGVRRALIGKIVAASGGDSDMLIRGLSWAHEQGAQIIAMSVGFDFAGTVADRLQQGWSGNHATAVALEAYRANLHLFDRLLALFREQEPFTGGSIIVAAAGNDSIRGGGRELIVSASPPAGSEGVISVGAVDPDGAGRGHCVSSFSNSGVGIAAPGRAIVSAALGGGLSALSGTSTAAMHVAGVAALWWQAVSQRGLPANATLIRRKLLSAAKNSALGADYPSEHGAGLAVAPINGLAVAVDLHGERFPESRSPRDRDGFWEERGTSSAQGAQFNPITLNLEKIRSSPSGGRRNLC